MPKCDICGDRSTHLNPLRDIYKTADIQDVCPSCERVVDKQLSKIQASHGQAQRTLLKRFMAIMRSAGAFNGNI